MRRCITILGDNLWSTTATAAPASYLTINPCRHRPLPLQRLLAWSELYNEYTRREKLWELCLVIMMHCNHNDVDEITYLWHR